MSNLYETTRFGILEPNPEDYLTLPQGLLDHPELTEFMTLKDDLGDPFFWVQSLQQMDFAFIVIGSADLSALGLAQKLNWEEIFHHFRGGQWPFKWVGSAFALVSMYDNILECTVDLSHPIIVDDDQQLGIQIHISGAREALSLFPRSNDPEYGRDPDAPMPYEGDDNGCD